MSLRVPVGAADHAQGALDAPVVLVEYGDYQCPYCGEVAPLLKQLQQRFGDDLCLVFRNFPLPEAHPEAVAAAITAEFAGRHGRFWEAHDLLYANQDLLGEDLYLRIAQTLGLDSAELAQALSGGPEGDRVEADLEGGLRSGVNGTPCFFINGTRFEPRSGFGELVDVIAERLSGRSGGLR